MINATNNIGRESLTRKRSGSIELRKKAIFKKIQDHFRYIELLMKKLETSGDKNNMSSLPIQYGQHSSNSTESTVANIQPHNRKPTANHTLSNKEKRMVDEIAMKLEDLYITLNFVPPFENE